MKNGENQLHGDDEKFILMADMNDFRDQINETTQQLEELSFDAFGYNNRLMENALPFLTYKVFKYHDLMKLYHIEMNVLFTFTQEIQKGYYKENSYSNLFHITDSLQAMHFFFTSGNLANNIKKLDILAVVVSNIIQDYEHSGCLNQFIIKTRHPLAIRYSD